MVGSKKNHILLESEPLDSTHFVWIVDEHRVTRKNYKYKRSKWYFELFQARKQFILKNCNESRINTFQDNWKYNFAFTEIAFFVSGRFTIEIFVTNRTTAMSTWMKSCPFTIFANFKKTYRTSLVDFFIFSVYFLPPDKTWTWKVRLSPLKR